MSTTYGLRTTPNFDLVEREAPLDVLAQALSETVAGSGRLVLLGGEAGVGKTALARHFCAEHGVGLRVLWGSCDPLFTPRPLGPLLDVAGGTGGELETLVAGEARPHEVTSALIAELRARQSILVVEDAHWADEATLDVVRLLGRRIEQVPSLVLVTYRDDELAPRHPLRIVIGELAARESIVRLRLEPLSGAAVAALAEPYEVEPVDLYEKTGGNPFFVTEVLAAGGSAIPATVRDAVLARAARLSAPATRVLEAVAVVPPQAELWLLEALAEGDLEQVDECLAFGMLVSGQNCVAFRHELARIAVEQSLGPARRETLHRSALTALAAPPDGEPDPARLAHHAEAAGDVEAVLQYAPAAAERAASLGAHREASAQYARALRHGKRLSGSERAELLERRAQSCYLTDQYDEGIAALEDAVELRRAANERLREGDALRRLSDFLWCPGRTAESERRAREAIALLETLPPTRELAWACANLADRCCAALRAAEALHWSRRALGLAESLGDREVTIHARTTIAATEDFEQLERVLADARREDFGQQTAHAFAMASVIAVETRRHEAATRLLEDGIAYCSERGLELHRLYLLADLARHELDRGRWDSAADVAGAVLHIPRTSTTPRILALAVLALVRARRGDPDQTAPLEEAWALAEPTQELPRIAPVAAARAEASWLVGDRQGVLEATASALELARERQSDRLIGELASWRRRAGEREPIGDSVAEPYALELAGRWVEAARLWEDLASPYEAALALAETADVEALRRALDIARSLGARPLAAIVSRRLRELGVSDVPRGPRVSTQANAAQLTAREVEVLGLMAEGLRNADIAERLFLSRRTIDHHVSAILRKLGASTRGEAVASSRQLGLLEA